MDPALEHSDVDPLVGTTIADRYRIVRKLGEGGMGVVYEGEHTLIKRRVAIKTLHSQFARNGAIVARFQREALAATSIGNEHIVEATDMGRLPDGSVFLVLEFLQGHELSDALAEGPMSLGRAVRITMQICDALQAAHDKGIVHRDLKPPNIFLIERGGDRDFVKVLDFGISKFQDAESESGGMTRTGAVLGTPNFMPPEQAQGQKDVDHRADIYAIGVILYRALSGQLPYSAPTFPMIVLQIVQGNAADLRFYRPDLPPEVCAIVHRAFCVDRDKRPASCAELRALLAPYANHDAPPSVGVAPTAVAPQAQTPAHLAPATAPFDLRRDSAPAATGAPAWAAPQGVTPAPSGERGSAPSQPGATPQRTGRIVLAAFGAALAAGLGFVIVRQAMRRAPTVQSTEASSASSAATPTSAAPVHAEPATAVSAPVPTTLVAPSASAPERTVHVRVSTAPTGATLRLDGLPIANPFDGDLPYSTDVHRVEASLPGYRTVIQEVTLHLPQTINLAMARGAGVESHSLTGPRTIAPAVTPPSRSINPAQPAPPPAPAQSTPPSPAPPAASARPAAPAAPPAEHPAAPAPSRPAPAAEPTGPLPTPAVRDPI